MNAPGSAPTIAVALAALSILPAPAADSEETSFAAPNSATLDAAQSAAYCAEVPRTILELQPFRRTVTESFAVAGRDDGATLVDLNPNSNAWFLLSLRRAATPGGLPIECVQSDGIAAPDCHGSFIDP